MRIPTAQLDYTALRPVARWEPPPGPRPSRERAERQAADLHGSRWWRCHGLQVCVCNAAATGKANETDGCAGGATLSVLWARKGMLRLRGTGTGTADGSWMVPRTVGTSTTIRVGRMTTVASSCRGGLAGDHFQGTRD